MRLPASRLHRPGHRPPAQTPPPVWARALTLLALAMSSVLMLPSAQAGTATGTIASSVTLGSDCSVTTTPLAIGTVSSLATSATANGTLTFQCTSGTVYTIGVGLGTSPNAVASSATRFMNDGAGHELQYYLFNFNTGTMWYPAGSGQAITPTGTGAPVSWPIELIIQPKASAMVPGNYADSVAVTLSY